MSDELVKTGKLPIGLKTGFAAKVQQAQQQGNLASDLFDCSRYPNRIVLCIDDSGSMCTHMTGGDTLTEANHPKTRIEMCKKACEEFLSVCNSRDTALGMYTISTGQEYTLSVAYPMLLNKIRELRDSGGTPTISTLDKIITKEKVTRVVLVSDGESGALDYYSENEKKPLSPISLSVLNKYKEAKVPVDTVYIGTENDSGQQEMQAIADYTGGLFMFFKSGESFRTKFKYLAPAFRGLLMSGEIKL